MRYIPQGHLKKPTFEHKWVRISKLPAEMQNVIHVIKNVNSDKDNFIRGEPRHHEVDLAYVRMSDTYEANLDVFKDYLLDLYYVISPYLTDADMAKILDHLYGGGEQKWHQWLSLDMLMASSFVPSHVKTLKAFAYILTSPHLKYMRNTKCERWFKEERINLTEVRNVIDIEEEISA